MFNNIYNEDCVDTINRICSQSLDLTLTSPPYNVNLDYDAYQDSRPIDEYIDWLSDIFLKIYDKTKPGGRLVINIGDLKNGKIPVSQLLSAKLYQKWLPFTQIIWDKGHTSARTAWGSYMSPSNPSFPRPWEHILVFCKQTRNLQNNGNSDLTPLEWKNAAYGIWKIPGEKKKNTNHPAAFPEELAIRCLKMFSYQNSTIYDPFMGSGTTAIACVKTNRQYIGSEISKQYFENSIIRLSYINTNYHNEFY